MKFENNIILGDCLEVMRRLPDRCVDLVFTSPPYEDVRTYSEGFNLRGQEWVDWAVKRFLESLRICGGIVAWVVDSRTKNYRWSGTPHLLAADLIRAGVNLRHDCFFHRVGIPGSGGPDYFRNDCEFIIVATGAKGKLPWSDNTACGHPPKWAPGGEMSHRLSDGSRVNQWGGTERDVCERGKNGKRKNPCRKSHKFVKVHTKTLRRQGNDTVEEQNYIPPIKANPGNIIKCNVGGGQMGSKLAHDNEAPFPESLADRFIRSFCPPGGIVLDPFAGSGTVAAVAIKTGRKYFCIDTRQSQIELIKRRIAEANGTEYPERLAETK